VNLRIESAEKDLARLLEEPRQTQQNKMTDTNIPAEIRDPAFSTGTGN